LRRSRVSSGEAEGLTAGISKRSRPRVACALMRRRAICAVLAFRGQSEERLAA